MVIRCSTEKRGVESASTSARNRSSSLAALLRRQAAERPDRGYTYLAQGEEVAAQLSYAALDRRARAIATALASVVSPGERALLLYPPGLELVSAFFGCLYAGVIAVPAYPPHGRRPDPRLRGIAADCLPRAVLTTAALLDRREALVEQVAELAPALWLDTELSPGESPDAEQAPRSDRPEDIAFLQYTSGSTGTPKGVMVTHANLLHNLELIRRTTGQTAESVMVGWLPLFHDMGLIGNVLLPCSLGSDCVLMPPASVLQKPLRWLRAIHRFRGTISGGPNFAYDLCAQSIGPEAREELDLSSWGVAFNGAEPVRAETLWRFAKAFAPCGFRRESFFPCYGLAEATLFVSGSRREAEPCSGWFAAAALESGTAVPATDGPGRELVSCGTSWMDQRIAVVDPESGVPCPDGRVGEIWVAGPSVAAGYWGRPEESAATFRARLGDDLFLRTGDLGFLAAGELFIAGRLKDLIILRGRNHYPQDLELTAEQSHPALRPGSGAAFSIDENGEEHLVVVSEVERRLQASDLSAIADAVRRAVAKEHGVRVADVVLLRTGTIPKTSSGKIRRRECRTRYLGGDLAALHRSGFADSMRPASGGHARPALATGYMAPRGELEESLAAIWADVLGLDRVGALDDFFELGGHSLMAMQLLTRVRETFAVEIPLRCLFDTPTLAGLAEWLRQRRGDPAAPAAGSGLPQAIPDPARRHEPFSLTDVQQAYWLGRGGAFELGNLATHAYLEIEAEGLDIPRLETAWQRLIERHEMLRAVILPDGTQRILERVPDYRIETQDLRGLPPAAAAVRLEEIRSDREHRERPADRWPLFEVSASLFGDRRVRLHVSFDLLIIDEWSFWLLLSELTALYREPETVLASLELSLRDYRLAEETLAGTERYRADLDYWRRRLRALPPAPELPLRTSPGALARPRFTRRHHRIGRERWRLLKSRAAEAGLTPSGLLLAAYAEVLTTWSKSPRFLINLTLFNRLPLHPQVPQLVGSFTSLTLLAVDASVRDSFAARARRLQQQLWEDLEHNLVGGVAVLRELAQLQGRPGAFAPVVFTSTIGLVPGEETAGSSARLGTIGYSISQTPQVWLDLQTREQDGELACNLDAVEELFPAGLPDTLFGAFQVLLDRLADDPEALHGPLPVLLPTSQLERRNRANATAAPLPEGLLHSYREADPSRPAVISARRTVTHGELYVGAHRLGAVLRAKGAAPGELVAVVMEKGWEQAVAVYGISASGAAYLPIDPGLPSERLRLLLEQGGARLAVTQPWLESRLDWPPGLSRMAVDEELLAEASLPELVPAQRQRDLAYVIFTSGSTGLPKGVMIDHLGALNTLQALNQRFAVGPEDRILGLSALNFDLSVYDLFGPLAAGGAVVLPEPEATRDPARWAEQMAETGVTLWNSVPALLEMLVDHLAARGGRLPASLRLVLLSGDWIPVGLPGRLRALAPGVEVISLGGATEASIWSILYPIGDIDPAWRSIPYGRPLPNQRFHVLDAALEERPDEVPGELFIAGDGLAVGYWRDEEKTRASFFEHPRTGERLYRTGDWGRWLPEGVIELLGREDLQVKIRGHRIELGEIETVLGRHPEVRECAVTVREDIPGQKRLVAYVAARSASDPSTAVLREHMVRSLPEAMIPEAFVLLSELPLSANGKVDRRSLPAPTDERRTHPAETTRPRTPVEEILTSLWSQILHREQIGLYSNFLELGGNSLLAARLASRIRQTLSVDLPLRDLFEAPTVAELAVRVEAARRDGVGRVSPPLVPVPRGGALPLSFPQQRLWLIDQLEPGSPLYNIPVTLRVEGSLDPAVLARCLGEIVRRHEVLRTVFAATEGAPVQVIRPAAPFALPEVDLSGLPESRREAAALALAGEEAARPFDLARGPLLRGMLLRLAASGDQTDHIAAVTLHHIAGDGWSMGLLVREVTALYAAFADGRPSPLVELPVQYADFAAWQRSWLHGDILESEISYWRRQLAGLPPLLSLPTDRPRPEAQSFRGASRPARLSAELARQAEALGRREGATLFMVLLAGFQALLARYSGQDDLAVGSPVAGRNRVEIEELIGFFVNTLVLRGNLTGEPTFRGLLGRVRETTLAAHAHQDVPFEKLVQELAPERSLAHAPFFQVMFALQNVPVESLEIQNLRLLPVSRAGTTAKFDLTLTLEEQGGALFGAVEHATDLFDAATIDHLILHYEKLLEAALAAPDLAVSDLPLLSPVERHQALAEWNDTGAAGEWEGPVSLLVERRAREQPAAPAVVDAAGRVLTYAELDERAGRLAGFLRALGVGPETVVGVLAERSFELVAGLLGVLKAGAAYVPLDPSYPAERLALMLAETAAPMVLTQEALLDRLPDLHARVVCLDRDWDEIESRPPLPGLRAEPDHLAYVLYTSGSTGRPKGVQIPHRGLMSLVRWDLRAYGTGPGDCRSQVASLGFDASAWEIWACLAAGAALHLPAEEVRLDPRRLGSWMAERGITISFLPTPLAEALLTTEGPEVPTLRWLLVGGDRLRLHPDPACGFALVNHYGPTEASVVTSAGTVSPRPRGEQSPAPSLGRPIDGLQVYLLDRSLHPAPPGVPGELWVGGPSLARGYLGDAGRTAERFAPDSIGQIPGGRLYRTGDLCRHRHDGSLEFLGRADQQIKLRGLRIEPGEIETVLASHSAVRECAVGLAESPAGARLAAWVVAAAEANEEALRAELRRHLAARLPDFMIPAAFVLLKELPLTPAGKVDRKALPAPEGRSLDESHLAPRTPVEEVLAGIWAQLLGLERVGANDHFFALGGHSLLATRVMSRLRNAFDVEMPLRDLFEAPVLADLAARVETARQAGVVRTAPPLVPVPREGTLPLSFAQQRLWFLDRLSPENPFYNIPMTLRVEGPLDAAVLARCFGEIVRRHEILRTVFVTVEGAPVQVIQPASLFRLPVVDLSSLPESRREAAAVALAGEEAARPFDLTRGPLLRGVLLHLAVEDHGAVLNLHHIAGDGWSMGILVRELTALYAAFAEGRPSPLAALPVQYADFSIWQRSWLHGEALESEITFWRRQLAGLPPLLELPTDRPRPAAQSFRGATRPVRLPAGLTRQAEALGRREGATLFMVLLAGFQALLARSSGQQDVAVGTPVAGRNRVEIEELIGFFVNTLVLRGNLTGEPTFRQLLGQVRGTVLAAHAHQDVPFERLVQELMPERSLAQTPLLQVMLALQNSPAASLEIQQLRLRLVEAAGTTAKFDLTLSLEAQHGGLGGTAEYATDLFDAATIERLIGHFERLLAAALAAPELTVAELPLLSPAERHQLLAEWNDTLVPRAERPLLHSLFEARAACTPDAQAAAFEGKTLTYAELDARANRLAHHLRGLGCGPESRVGVILERSLDLVAALLGVLKAGAAYVPLDPGYPRERLAFVLESSAPQVLITETPLLAALPPAPGLVLCLDREPIDALPLVEQDNGAPIPADDRQLAYVLYTSGSTGRPKGVGVPHQAVVNFLDSMRQIPGFEPGERLLAVTSLAFDIAALEIFLPLTTGGCVVLASRTEATDGALLAARLRTSGASVLQATPATWRMLLDAGWAGDPGLKALCGGEALPRELAMSLAGRTRELWNLYGPTETTVWSAVAHIRPGGAGPVSLGRPIANTWIRLLGRELQTVPLGAPGELWIGGAGVARGYLDRPDLTAERFLPDPCAAEPGARMYRTGDLVRQTAAGELEFLGRVDHQTKIRGFRIELGEIEAHLDEHPAVLQSIVLTREDVAGDRRLVAYVVQSPAHDVLENEAQSEQVSQWSEVFENVYQAEASAADPTFNISGWNSSYTGLPIPREEMEDWLEETVERILSLSPRRVLEIGCGSGMILFRVAPGCELYTGTDISARALEFIEGHLGRMEGVRSRVRLLRSPAERFEELENGSFDTVVVNSVAQYFPSADYLAEVLAHAVDVVRPGGSIFLGDLRSLPLLETFHTSLELFHAKPEMRLPELRQKVLVRGLHENELAIDPAFFAALQQRLPNIVRVEVHPKRGRARNELTSFRYQAVLRIGEPAPTPEEPGEISWRDWRAEALSLASLRRLLEEDGPEALGLRNVPNARVAEHASAARLLLAAETGIETVGDLRRQALGAAGAVEPQDLWDLGLELPYEVELGWASPGPEGCFEAVLRRRGGAGPISALLPAPQTAFAARPLSHFTSNPLQGRFARRIAPELRAFLIERLPEYMVPSSFVLLDAFPLSPNGKVDRRRLPAPDLGWRETGHPLVAPRNATEESVREIWKELLGPGPMGVEDDFFTLGGHSLLATQVISRVRNLFAVDLPVRALFEEPTVAGLAARIDRERQRGAAALAPPLVPVSREQPLPLSFAQQRLWFIDQLEPESALYNLAAALRVEGPLDAAVLALCLGEIVRRHEVLRTVIATPEGSPVQKIQPAAPFGLPVVDLSGLPGSPCEALAVSLAKEEAGRPFDLTRGPLLRGLLLRLAEGDHIAALTLHHIAGDGWSMGILVREVTALYASFAERRPSPLLEPPVQYADYSAWQHSWLHGEILESEITYWRRQLAGLPPRLELPIDRPRPAVQSFRGASQPVRLPAELTRQMQALARRERATLFMVVQAGFQVLLSRYSGQQDLAVGTPVAGRNRTEIEGLIGFFVNTLVLRGDLTGEPAFRELIGRVRETALAAHAHQDVPFEKLVQQISPERSLAQTPLFQVMFVLQNAPVETLEIRSLRLRPLKMTGATAKFDLTLSLEEIGDELQGVVEHATDLFDAATISRLILHFERLLAAAAESLGSLRLSELPLLTSAEASQVALEWNDTARASGDPPCVHHLIALQAARAPEAVAVASEGRHLTFGELAALSDHLAAHLRALGVGPEALVAVFLERSVDLVVALIAVLKAGGAYLPLEVSHPRRRLSLMLEDARVPLVLTRTRLLSALPESSARVACIDDLREGPARPGRAVPPAADNLAYVLYTSGSTGKPKGVAVTHRGLANYLLWAAEAYPAGEGRGAPVHSPVSFDLTVTSLFLPLLAGRCVVLMPEEDGIAGLVAALAEGGFGLVKLTPAHLELLPRMLSPERASGCAGAFVIGGEPLSGEQLAFWREHAPALRLINEYGPTETVVGCCVYEIPASSAPEGPVPIGRPIANTRVQILDRGLHPVPMGVPGELCIGGAGVCRGYLHRPDLTAEKLVPDPFGSWGERLYRTGDVARHLPDGTMAFLGRVDHQVKVRGFRIEPGEIERVLQEHPGVHQAVVVARSDGPAGQKQLVAYSTAGAPAPAAADLRRFLAERLPDHMVPASFIALDVLPLSPNGKLDRAALPAPGVPRSGAACEHVAPRTREEELLATIWAQILGLPRVGMDDNFFELGGDSILSIQIVARARQAGLHLTVRQVFEHQTVAELARCAAAAETSGATRSAQGPVSGEVPLTPIQCWFFAQGFADPHHFNQALLLEAAEPLAPAALERAVAAVIEHHDALRLRFIRQDGPEEAAGWSQENAAAEPATPVHRIDLSGLPASRRRAAFDRAAAALQSGFDLSAGPLTRLALFGGVEPLLLWTAHHLVVDGVSWRLLLEDLESAYRQAVRGFRPVLPPKTTPFRDWAYGLATHAASEVPVRELDHWLGVARIPVPRLPVDFPAGGGNTFGDEAAVSFELTRDETSDLLQTVPAVYHNRIDEALLSSLARALAAWTGSPHLRVDLEGHGREPLLDDVDTSRTVGWFTALYPVVLEAGDADPGTALVSAKERLRSVPGRGIGYGLLRWLGNRPLVESPEAEVVFNYLGQIDAASGGPSLFRPSLTPAGSTRSPRARRPHLLDVNGLVAGGRLRITLTYGCRVHRRETVERLAEAYAQALRQLIQHSREREGEVFTPSDFPKARLDTRSLHKLAALLAEFD